MTSTLHADARSLERAGFLLIIANTRSQKKDIRRLRIHIYIHIPVYHTRIAFVPSRKRAPAFSSARVYIFRGKIFRNYPSLLYPTCVLMYNRGKNQKIKLISLARRSGTHASGGREKEAIFCARVFVPPAHTLRVLCCCFPTSLFLIEPFVSPFSLSLFSFAHSSSKPLRRRRDGMRERERDFDPPTPVGFFPLRVSSCTLILRLLFCFSCGLSRWHPISK